MKYIKRSVCFVIIFLLIFSLCGCSSEQNKNDKMEEYNNYIIIGDLNGGHYREWISPDGVHYWVITSGAAGYMAPRYDSSGNLIIDK